MLANKLMARILCVAAAVLGGLPAAIAETKEALEAGRSLAEKLQRVRPGIPIEEIVRCR